MYAYCFSNNMDWWGNYVRVELFGNTGYGCQPNEIWLKFNISS